MLKTKKISEVIGKKVYTDEGDFFGKVEEVILVLGKVYGWAIAAEEGSYLSQVLGNTKKGVIVPHNLVRAIGDIMIISKTALKTEKEDLE
ncbi:MAG TPA: photosystem reaction center subunit H [Nautiliaceae bacterium]|nr:photosystem reaction center subunit H [Nautiliaceae bacterium]